MIERAAQGRNGAVLVGQPTQREVERVTQEMHRVYRGAGAFVQQKDHMVDHAKKGALAWAHMAHNREGVVKHLAMQIANVDEHV